MTTPTIFFSDKDPLEQFPLTFPFGPLPDGSTIQSVVSVVVTVFSGTDALPGDILQGAAAIAGDIVRQVVKGGLDGVSYLVRATILTAAGNKFTLGAVLPVKLSGS